MTDTTEKIPPHNEAAEIGVLGAMLIDSDAADIAIAELKAKDFYIPNHQRLFDALSELYRQHHTLDEIFVVSELAKRNGFLANIGGREYIAKLIMDTPSAAQIETYCEIVADTSKARALITAMLEGLRDCHNGQVKEATRRLEGVLKAPAGQVSEIEDMVSILAAPPPRPDDLIEGLAFTGSKIQLSAPSKARKTFFILHMLLCIATGVPWFGRQVLQGTVLYLNFELHPWSLQARCRAILDLLGVNLPPSTFEIWNLRGKNITIESLKHQLEVRAVSQKYVAIAFDPLYKLLGKRNENAAAEVADLLAKMEEIGHAAGAAVLYAHHFAKGNASGKEAIDRSSGSGVVGRDGDCILVLTPHEEEDCFSLEFIHRDHPPVESFVVRWEYPIFRRNDGLDPQRLKQPARPRTKQLTSADVMAAVTTTPEIRETIIRRMQEQTKRGENACRDAFNEANDAGLLQIETLPRRDNKPILRFSKIGVVTVQNTF